MKFDRSNKFDFCLLLWASKFATETLFGGTIYFAGHGTHVTRGPLSSRGNTFGGTIYFAGDGTAECPFLIEGTPLGVPFILLAMAQLSVPF